MDNNQKTKVSGRFAWLISVLELLILIAYFVIGARGIHTAMKNMDFVGMFDSVYKAIWFLVIATMFTTILCFLRPFKSKGTMYIAVWNIVWIGFSLYALCG